MNETQRGLRATMSIIDEYVGEETSLRIIYDICKEIQNTSSTIEKQNLLKRYKNNERFKMVLKFLLDPMIVTGISKKKIDKDINIGCYENEIRDYWLEDLLEYLSTNNTGRDVDIAYCQFYISKITDDEELQNFIKSIITKSLKLGIDVKTANKVYGKDFIPVLNVMLANKYFDNQDKVRGDFTITEKFDGFRCICIIRNGKVIFYSRQGKLIEGLKEIEYEIKNLNVYNIVFDGELVSDKCDEISNDENYKITTKIARTNGDKYGLRYYIFDTLTLDEFFNQKGKHPYSYRRSIIDKLPNTQHIKVAPILYRGNDMSQIMTELERAKIQNKEGVMINLNNAPYEFKRTNSLLKVKIMQDADLLIKSVYEGTGRNVGKLGGIVVEFEHKGNKYECNCGSGFDDDERIKYWNNPNELIGKIATIKFFEISKNDNGGYGLRFPIWTHRIRNDKTQISMN